MPALVCATLSAALSRSHPAQPARVAHLVHNTCCAHKVGRPPAQTFMAPVIGSTVAVLGMDLAGAVTVTVVGSSSVLLPEPNRCPGTIDPFSIGDANQFAGNIE